MSVLEYSPSNSIFGGLSQADFAKTISGENQTTSANNAPIVSTTEANAVAPNRDDNPQVNGPSNTPIYASGNASTSKTALAKSNQSVAHVCNIPAGVMNQIYKAGALGGQIVMAIRKAIKSIIAFFGINPSGNSIVQYLKKLAGWIRDGIKWLKDINKFIDGFITIVNVIKQMITFILSLPAQLMAFFKDCLEQAYAMLKAGYLSVIAAETGAPLDSETQALIDSVKEVRDSYNDLMTEVQKTMDNASNAINSVTTLEQTADSGTMTQEEKTALLNDVSKTFYADNGHAENSPSNYSMA